jgi:excisionase family DNA binding protein
MERQGHGLISEGELARHLRVSARTIRRLVEEGRLRRVRLGHAPAYVWDDVWKYLGIRPVRGMERGYMRTMMTPEDVAARCIGIGPGRIKRLARQGEIPAYRVGRAFRFAPVEIQRWFAQHALGTAYDLKIALLAGSEQNGT